MYFGTSYSNLSNPYASGGYGSCPASSTPAAMDAGSEPLKPLVPPSLVTPIYGGAVSCADRCTPSIAAAPPGSPQHLRVSAPLYGSTMPSVVETRSPKPLATPSSPSTSPEKQSQKATQNFKVEVVQANMSVNADGPVYQIKLDLNGRSYTATRHHNKLRSLVEQLKTRGYRILSPFPEVDDVDAYAPAKAFDGAFSDLPIYENFGYSIKSLASSVFRSTTGRSLSSAGANNGLRKSYRMEQISTRIDNFLKSIFSENEELQYEQQVYHFFWEPLEKKLPVVVEEELETADEEEEVLDFSPPHTDFKRRANSMERHDGTRQEGLRQEGIRQDGSQARFPAPTAHASPSYPGASLYSTSHLSR